MKSLTENPQSRATESKPEWASNIERHLAQAAKLAAEHGVTPEAFIAAAWQSYLRASPAYAEQLEQTQFLAGLEQLRSAGRLAKA
jgi:hypothetical protein